MEWCFYNLGAHGRIEVAYVHWRSFRVTRHWANGRYVLCWRSVSELTGAPVVCLCQHAPQTITDTRVSRYLVLTQCQQFLGRWYCLRNLVVAPPEAAGQAILKFAGKYITLSRDRKNHWHVRQASEHPQNPPAISDNDVYQILSEVLTKVVHDSYISWHPLNNGHVRPESLVDMLIARALSQENQANHGSTNDERA
ncbi:MAG: hypothetical protein RMJ19_05535 [Gemmatales bacterium]|nr:hypothetical protein [Gemmatales bacterium]MDW8175115.1 hypothetical protein [Gemmatales bacterium]